MALMNVQGKTFEFIKQSGDHACMQVRCVTTGLVYDITVHAWDSQQAVLLCQVDGQAYRMNVVPHEDGGWLVSMDDGQQALHVKAGVVQVNSQIKRSGAGIIKSPLAGRVVRLCVAPGDIVHEGKPLLVVESMKMENEVCASGSAYVRTILVQEGVVVRQGQSLLECQALEGENDGTEQSKVFKAPL